MKADDERINILMVDDSATNLLALEAILQAPIEILSALLPVTMLSGIC